MNSSKTRLFPLDSNTLVNVDTSENVIDPTVPRNAAQDYGQMLQFPDAAANGFEPIGAHLETPTTDSGLELFIEHASLESAGAFVPQPGETLDIRVSIINSGAERVDGVTLSTSRPGIFDLEFPTVIEPGTSVTRTWTVAVTEKDVELGDIEVELLVVGESASGTHGVLASMATLEFTAADEFNPVFMIG